MQPNTGHAIVPALKKDRTQLALTAQGILAETFPLTMAGTNQAAPSTQVVYGGLLGLRAGDVITNVVIAVTTAASGTAPTTVKMGLYSKAGLSLALTANLAADSGLTSVGVKQFPLSASYAVTADDGYYVVLLKDGVFGSTDVQFSRQTPNTGQATALAGQAARLGIFGTSQTDLKAVGQTGTFAVNANAGYWLAVN